eukprot:TRINITY_DN5098_c0_g2_i1.p1 TRINITY_DN5098_c0_g2~~TRINITY_DN5098_c0_g2_i1.p1  ORF type:complete len:315 (+),score=62.27 TRINITY_DN5098_c0_g2_i1:27-947(+)
MSTAAILAATLLWNITVGPGGSLAANGSAGYVASADGFKVLSLSDGKTMGTSTGCGTTAGVAGVVLGAPGQVGVLCSESALLINITDSTQPKHISQYKHGLSGIGMAYYQSEDMYIYSTIEHITHKELDILHFPSTIIGKIDNLVSNGISVHKETAFILGTDNLAVLNVSNPAAPTQIASMESIPQLYGGNALEVSSDGATLAFAGAGTCLGLASYDAATRSLSLLGTVPSGSGLAVKYSPSNPSGVLYVACDRLVHKVDITNPKDLKVVATFTVPQYVEDLDVSYLGGRDVILVTTGKTLLALEL